MIRPTQFEKGNFITVPNKHLVLKLRGASVNVYLAIVSHANDAGVCFPSIGRICEETGYARRQVIRALADLIDQGLLQKSGRARDDGSQTSNTYQLYLFHTPRVTYDTPPRVTYDTPGGVSHGTPELKHSNSNIKNREGPKKRSKIARSGSTSSIREVLSGTHRLQNR